MKYSGGSEGASGNECKGLELQNQIKSRELWVAVLRGHAFQCPLSADTNCQGRLVNLNYFFT